MTNTDTTTNSLEPKIYVACLRAYNAGHLHGAWIKANQPIDEIYSAINQMLSKSPEAGAEDWAIHDYEDFGSIHIKEYTDIETIVAIADLIEEYGELGAEAVAYNGNCPDDARKALEEYCGEFDSEEDYARQLMEDCYEVPEYLQFYIDYDKFAHDLFVNDNYSIDIRGKCHVFRYV